MAATGAKPEVVLQLRRRRVWRRVLGGIVGLVILTSLLDHLGAFHYRGDDWQNFDHESVRVTRVIDGDTVIVRRAGGGDDTTVRLLGVDASEMHYATHEPPDFWAERATNYSTSRMKDKLLTIRLEPTRTRDRYGRLLAYLYLTESDNLNLDLIHDGQAYADRRFRHSFASQFQQAENEARSKRRGLWENVREDQMPPWRREWLRYVQSRHPAN